MASFKSLWTILQVLSKIGYYSPKFVYSIIRNYLMMRRLATESETKFRQHLYNVGTQIRRLDTIIRETTARNVSPRVIHVLKRMRNVLLNIQDGANEYLAIAVRYDKIRYGKSTKDTNREIQNLLWTINKDLPKIKDRLKIHKLESMKRYLQTVRVLEDGTKIYDKHDLNRYIRKINHQIKRTNNTHEISTLEDKIIDANRAYNFQPSLKETQKQNTSMQEAVIKFRLNQYPVIQEANKITHEKNKFDAELRRLGVKTGNDRIWFGKNYKSIKY